VIQGVIPEFKPQYCKKEKNKPNQKKNPLIFSPHFLIFLVGYGGGECGREVSFW
jgi:hypothetical protein